MTFDTDSNIYITVYGHGDINVLYLKEAVIKHINLDEPSTPNITSGPQGCKEIYFTEHGIGQLEVHDIETNGLPL